VIEFWLIACIGVISGEECSLESDTRHRVSLRSTFARNECVDEGGSKRCVETKLRSACVECKEECVNKDHWKSLNHRPRWWPLRRCLAQIEHCFGSISDQILEFPALALMVAFAFAVLLYLPTPKSKSSLSLDVSAGAVTSATISQAQSAKAASPGWVISFEDRVSERWPLILALTGLISALKLFQSVNRGQSRYLTQDLTIEPFSPNDVWIRVTTVVENKLENDKEIHNSIVLVASQDMEPKDVLSLLAKAYPKEIESRLECGRRLRTWEIASSGDDATAPSLKNYGTWAERRSNDDVVEALLRSCPLVGCFEAGEGASYCHLQSVPFYMNENDDIANERITFPVRLPAVRFVKGEVFVVRFYLIGRRRYTFDEASSRCTARSFCRGEPGTKTETA
jgi:hypothetical protein